MLVPPVLNVPDAHYAAAKEVVAQLQAAGYQALLAGGCVRDRLLGHTPHDYDVVTSAPPEQVMALFPHTVAVGAQFGVVRVLTRSYEFEVATFRSDGEYRDGRRPVQVVYADPRADAARRDFTINALFYDPVHDQVLDYFDGQKDLQARVIRAVGEPAQRFREDHLRPLRAVRLAAQLGFRIEPATYQAVQEAAPLVRTVSGERIRDELNRILTGPDPAQGFRLLQDTGLLAVILPEVAAYAGVEQTPDYHPEGDVWQHTLGVLDELKGADVVAAWGGLLHDVAKPVTQSKEGERIHFYRHEQIGIDMARGILERLHFSNREIDEVCFVVEYHLRIWQLPQMRPAKAKRLMAHAFFPTLLRVALADARASQKDPAGLSAFLATIPPQELSPPVLLSGDDLIAAGLAPGPLFKRILDEVRDAQLEGRVVTKAEALALALELARAGNLGR